MKLSPQMKKVAIAGGGLLVLLLAVKILVLHPKNAPETIPVVVHPAHHIVRRSHVVRRSHGSQAKAKARPPQIDPSLPAALRQALAKRGIVVAVIAMPGTLGDKEAVEAARAGAQAAHAGFAVLDVSNETVARAMAAKVPGASAPLVLVVTRPGKIAVQLAGFADSEAVAQAAVDARP